MVALENTVSSLFVAFAVDAKTSTTLITRMCDSHIELLKVHKELLETHGKDCLILTYPSLNPVEKDMGIMKAEVYNELVAQSGIRQIAGLPQVIS